MRAPSSQTAPRAGATRPSAGRSDGARRGTSPRSRSSKRPTAYAGGRLVARTAVLWRRNDVAVVREVRVQRFRADADEHVRVARRVRVMADRDAVLVLTGRRVVAV